MEGADEATDLETSFSQVALSLFASGTVGGTLRQIVDVAVQTIDGCDAAGILSVRDGVPTTDAASGDFAARIDRVQVEAGEGPCLDAALGGSRCYARDLVDDPRWPVFGPRAVAEGARCVLSYPLSTEHPTALNLYAHLPQAFGATGRAQGVLFATLARLALDSAEGRAAGDTKADNLQEAMRTRELIGQAQGILMERERITGDQAFDVLRRASQHTNRKLHDVALNLIESGESPDTGPHP